MRTPRDQKSTARSWPWAPVVGCAVVLVVLLVLLVLMVMLVGVLVVLELLAVIVVTEESEVIC